jgi:hypothetical protein
VTDILSLINWTTVLSSAAAFVVGIVVKTLLDFRLALWLVRYFWWVRPRWILGENPHTLAGTWEHIWGAGGSEGYANPTDRHCHATMRQLGRYCYADMIYKGVRYYFYGAVHGQYLVGEWFDLTDRSGYFGVFQLRVVNSNRMEGKWMGHSQSEQIIRVDTSEWTRVKA